MTIQACAEIVQRGDPDRFLAAMAAPVAARRVLFPLYAFNVEVARAPWVTEEAMIAEMRLQWWRDALDEIAQGKVVRAHEVTAPLAEVLSAKDADILDKLVQARRWDIYKDPFEDDAHFSEYLDATSGHLAWVSARAMGVSIGEKAVRDVAWASGLANWFQAIPTLEAHGRMPLVDGRTDAVRALAEQGLGRLRAARLPKAAKPAVLAAWQAKGILKRAQNAPHLVAQGGLETSEFRRRAGLMWRSFWG